jgi:hypothetical protein
MKDDAIKWALAFMIMGVGTGLGIFFQVSLWHEISYFLKWKNSLSCGVTYFSFASSTYTGFKCINSKNCWYQFTFFSSVSSHLPVREVWSYHLGW